MTRVRPDREPLLDHGEAPGKTTALDHGRLSGPGGKHVGVRGAVEAVSGRSRVAGLVRTIGRPSEDHQNSSRAQFTHIGDMREALPTTGGEEMMAPRTSHSGN